MSSYKKINRYYFDDGKLRHYVHVHVICVCGIIPLVVITRILE